MTPLPRIRAAARRALVVVAFVGALLVWGPGAGPAAADDESVSSFDAVIDVDPRGDLHVTETITYVFAGAEDHGLQRELRTRVDQPGDSRDRLFPVSGVTVASPSGAPAQVLVSDLGSRTVIRVGDPLRTVTGRHTYVLRYTVAGAFTRTTTTPAGVRASAPHDKLYWNVTGTEWDVPIDRVSIHVTGPEPATAAECYRGVDGSTERCAAAAGTTSTFTAEGLPPPQGVTVALVYPAGTVAAAGPVLADGSGLPRSTVGQPQPTVAGQAIGFVLLLAVVAGLMALVLRVRAWAAASTRTTPSRIAEAGPEARADGASAPVPAPYQVDPVETPPLPDGLRPGQLAVVLDGRAGPVAITATLLDLARRGFLRLRPMLGTARRPGDWLIVARQRTRDGQLLPYEQGLLDVVFDGRGNARISSLYRRQLATVERQLVADAIARGWVTDDAEHAGLMSAKRVLHALDADRPLHRTPVGETLLATVDRVATEVVAMCAGELFPGLDPETFSRWLPYILVLGLDDEWAEPFRRSAPPDTGLIWYGGMSAESSHADICAGVTAFSTCVGHASAADHGSSGSSWLGHSGGSGSGSGFGFGGGSGGFGGSDHSGGGGGGGGGSSW